MLVSRVLRRSVSSFPLSFNSAIAKMSANKIVDVFNQIDAEMTYIKNKLDSLGEFAQGNNQSDSAGALQKLREENKSLQQETLEILKQISVYDLLEGKPPLALKVFMQAKVEKSGTEGKSVVESVVKADESQKPEKSDPKKQKTETDAEKPAAPETSPVKGKNKKAEKSDAKKDAAPAPSEAKKDGKEPAASDEVVTVARLDFRVGKIVEVAKHPDADSLYVEKIDLGEGGTLRTIVSGLVKFVPIEEMQNRMVVVLANLKPAKMRGVSSEGMVMCASTPEKVEILIPPKGSQPGDRVSFEGYPGTPDDVLNPKKKIWETVAPDLSVNADKVAVYKGVPFVVAGKGPVVSPTLINVSVK